MTRILRRVTAVLAGLSVLLGCGLTTIRPREMAPRLQYTGFSFARPPSESWFIRKAEERPAHVIVRHEHLEGEYHSGFVSFAVYEINFPLRANELGDFMRREDMRAETVIDYRSYVQKPISLQNQACVETRADADVTSQVTDAPLRMLNHVITCIHPAFPRALVEAMVPERGPPDQVGLDPRFAAEGEEMLRGFEIDVGPNQPAR